MKLELIKEDFPLRDEESVLTEYYTKVRSCAIANALTRLKIKYIGVSGWGIIYTKAGDFQPEEVFDFNQFVKINNEFMGGRTEPFVLSYPEYNIKNNNINRIKKFFNL